ncbi:MAG TPA: serine hydrolase domain-containing protein [Thermomicrobiales bacterium]|nr:serine hydrolase domain-containing protein [Thermomicrobiales bacterium]
MSTLALALTALDSWVENEIVPGAAAVVMQSGTVVASNYVGSAREAVAVAADTRFALASVSKPITVAAIMLAVQRGELDLDMPIGLIVPEAGEVSDPLDDDVIPPIEALRDRVTLRHLLCHTSGFPENVGVKRVRMREEPSLATIVDVMCGLPLQSAPGEVLRYSNVGIGIASRALESVTDKSIHNSIRGHLLQPLGLQEIALTPGPEMDSSIALVRDAANAGTPTESYNSPYWRSLGIPWGGYFGTAEALARFATSFLPGADSPLDGGTRNEMIVDQTGGLPGGVNSAGIHWNRGAWGLGWEVAADKRHHWTGSLRSPRTFCHWGQSGTLVWADPARELVLAVFANRAVHSPWPLKPDRWAQLSDAVVEAADSKRPR